MKKNILFLLFILFTYLTTNNVSLACDTNYASASCCSYNYCSGCDIENYCDYYSWGVWQSTVYETHEYNSTTCCPAPTAIPPTAVPPTAVPTCVPAESCPTYCHTNTQYVPNGYCGSTACYSNAPAAGTCPTYCDYDGGSVPDGSCGTTTCPATGSCCSASDGSDGVCGTAAGQTTVSPPPSSSPPTTLCSTGTGTAVTLSGSTFSWTCLGTSGYCGGSNGSNTPCTSIKNGPPTYISIQLKNFTGTIINAEVGTTRNQICDSQFDGSRAVKFTVTGTDPDGNDDISDIQLKWNGNVFTKTSLTNGIAVFDVTFLNNLNNGGTYPLLVNITDTRANTTGWIPSGRVLKVWDCSVPVSGALFDGSKYTFGAISCASGSSDFTNRVGVGVSYELIYKDIDLNTDKLMSINSPYYSSIDSLYWGANYRPETTTYNNVMPVMRYPGSNTCNSTDPLASFTIDNNAQMLVDPYAINVGVTIDYSTVVDHLPWYQVAGGGVVAANNIDDDIPDSCVDLCKPNISKNTLLSQSGLVAAQAITTGYGSYSEVNNWNVKRNIVGINYGYKYFYNEYYAKSGQGKVYGAGVNKNMSEIVSDTGGTGVVFVDGDVTVNVGNTVPVGEFFMLITSNNINVGSSVAQMQGIFIADNIFSSVGVGDSQLGIDGSIYSRNNVSFTRDFNIKTYNNRNPSILVTVRPDFIFSMPGKLTKILSGWKEGI